jgi:WD40 repeat protein
MEEITKPNVGWIRMMLRDISRVASVYSTPVHGAALQVYDSVLATMPICALFRRSSVTIEDIPMLISPRSEGWRPEELILEGHEWSVSSVAFSPDGKHIASGSDDSTVRVWNAVTGMVEHTLSGHDSSVTSVAFSTDGTHIASGSHDETVWVWNAVTGMVEHTLSGHEDWVTSVAFSTDGTHIASGSNDWTVRVWNTVTGAFCMIIQDLDPSGGPSTLSSVLQSVSASSCNCTSIHDSLYQTSATTEHASPPLFTLEHSTGWINRYDPGTTTWKRVCWLPNELRHQGWLAQSDEKVVVFSSTGRVTILDFSRLKQVIQIDP